MCFIRLKNDLQHHSESYFFPCFLCFCQLDCVGYILEMFILYLNTISDFATEHFSWFNSVAKGFHFRLVCNTFADWLFFHAGERSFLCTHICWFVFSSCWRTPFSVKTHLFIRFLLRLANAVSLDCEMVGVGEGGHDSCVARVSIVDKHGKVLYDKYCKPEGKITDYRTKYSGIRPHNLADGQSHYHYYCNYFVTVFSFCVSSVLRPVDSHDLFESVSWKYHKQ